MLLKKHHEKRNIFLLLTFLFLFLTLQAYALAQPGAANSKDNYSIPEGIKGERIKAFIENVNSDDPDRINEFFNIFYFYYTKWR